MGKTPIRVISIIFLLLPFFFGEAQTAQPPLVPYTFTRNMRFGDRGIEVKNLQRSLNLFPTSVVAVFGPGSPGNETEFFGNLTFQAVIRFQELHRNDILLPIGLTAGTGFFGPLTREKLNALLTAENKMNNKNISGAPRLVSIYPTSGVEGTKVTITGTGFSETNNTVLSGTATYKNIPSSNGSIEVIVTSSIPEGAKKYYLPIDLKFLVRVGDILSNELTFTLVGEGDTLSDEVKNQYKNKTLELLNLPDGFRNF